MLWRDLEILNMLPTADLNCGSGVNIFRLKLIPWMSLL